MKNLALRDKQSAQRYRHMLPRNHYGHDQIHSLLQDCLARKHLCGQCVALCPDLTPTEHNCDHKNLHHHEVIPVKGYNEHYIGIL